MISIDARHRRAVQAIAAAALGAGLIAGSVLLAVAPNPTESQFDLVGTRSELAATHAELAEIDATLNLAYRWSMIADEKANGARYRLLRATPEQRVRRERELTVALQRRDSALARARLKTAGLEARRAELLAQWAQLQGLTLTEAERQLQEPASAVGPQPTGGSTTKSPTASPSTSSSGTATDPTSSTGSPTATDTSEPISPEAATAIRFAKRQLGDPYRYGADGPDRWDCSGLTSKAWLRAGVSLPHWSVAQFRNSTKISVDELQPGDLMFWSSNATSSGIYHVALYLGDDTFIHAPRSGTVVRIETIHPSWAPKLFARVTPPAEG